MAKLKKINKEQELEIKEQKVENKQKLECVNITLEVKSVRTWQTNGKYRGGFDLRTSNGNIFVYISPKFIHSTSTGKMQVGIVPTWKYTYRVQDTQELKEASGRQLIDTFFENKQIKGL